MQILNNTLIAECSAYDFKEMLERKKVKSWLKSVSAFANTNGGSLFYGVNDDGEMVGLSDPQGDADAISEAIKARLDPVPDVELIPMEHEGKQLLEVRVKAGTLTPYYYYQGSGLRKMRELTEKLPNFLPGKEPQYHTEAISFYTTFYNLNWGENGRIPVEEVAERVNKTGQKFGDSSESPVGKFGVNANEFGEKKESSVKRFGDPSKSSERKFGDPEISSERKFGEPMIKPKNVGRTAQKIIDFVISDPSISAEAMAFKIGISSRAVEKQIAKLREMGILSREGADFGGYWRIIINPLTEQ